jgi:hypothetical protein
MSTGGEPDAITPGGPAQVVGSPSRAAIKPPINTVGAPIAMGPPTCGTKPVNAGQATMSVTRAAGSVIKTPDNNSTAKSILANPKKSRQANN